MPSTMSTAPASLSGRRRCSIGSTPRRRAHTRSRTRRRRGTTSPSCRASTRTSITRLQDRTTSSGSRSRSRNSTSPCRPSPPTWPPRAAPLPPAPLLNRSSKESKPMNAGPSFKPAAYTTDAADTSAPRGKQTHEKYERLIALAKGIPAIPTAVVWPCEEHALAGPIEAAEENIIVPILVGPAKRMRAVAEKAGLDISRFATVDVSTEEEAAATAVRLVRDGKAQSLMKGSLHTDVLMHEVVAKDSGLRTGRRISHVFILDVPTYPEALFVTDAAINIFPDLETKRDIVQNAIDLHIGLGLGEPRVAILSAVEVINPKIPGTTDAASLCKMAERGQISGGILDGPLAMDNAINAEAAAIKGIHSPVAGRAQILVVPDLEAGNMLAKNVVFLGQADAAGIVLGAAVPIILTSRADSVRTRMASTAVGALYGHHLAEQRDQTGSRA